MTYFVHTRRDLEQAIEVAIEETIRAVTGFTPEVEPLSGADLAAVARVDLPTLRHKITERLDKRMELS